jgi:amidase
MVCTEADIGDWKTTVKQKQWQLELSIRDIHPVKPALGEDLPLNVTGIPKRVLSTSELQITETPAEKLVQYIAEKKFSSLEVTRAFLKRAAVASRLVNCVTEFMQKAALERAMYLDEYLRKNGRTVGPLHGLPISTKEHMKHRGLECNAGFVSWMGVTYDSEALVAKILFDAGCIFYVRTTQPQTLMQLETSSSIHGVTVKPYNRNLTAGGSSGGEGALLGLRGSCLGIGSDIGGSIRNPAANNGLFGLKPTSHRLPLDGFVVPQAGAEQIMGVIGPMSTSLPGIELFMKTVLDGKPWTSDPTLVPMPWRASSSVTVTKRRFRVGILADDGVVRPHPPILRVLAAMRKSLEESGEFDIIEFPPYKHDEAWRIISSLYFADGGAEIKQLIDQSGEPWRPLSKFILHENTNVKELTVKELRELTAQRDRYRNEYHAHRNRVMASSEADLILCPAGPGLAPPLDCSKYWSYTSQWNLLDYPAIVFPTGAYGDTSDVRDIQYCSRNVRDEYNQKLCNSRCRV